MTRFDRGPGGIVDRGGSRTGTGAGCGVGRVEGSVRRNSKEKLRLKARCTGKGAFVRSNRSLERCRSPAPYQKENSRESQFGHLDRHTVSCSFAPRSGAVPNPPST